MSKTIPVCESDQDAFRKETMKSIEAKYIHEIHQRCQNDEGTDDAWVPDGGEESGRLYVGRIIHSITTEDLHKAFETYGPVQEARILKYRSGTSRRNGCITMCRDEDAMAAELGLHGDKKLGSPSLIVTRTNGKVRQFRENRESKSSEHRCFTGEKSAILHGLQHFVGNFHSLRLSQKPSLPLNITQLKGTSPNLDHLSATPYICFPEIWRKKPHLVANHPGKELCDGGSRKNQNATSLDSISTEENGLQHCIETKRKQKLSIGDPSSTLFFGNIPLNMEELQLFHVLSMYGPVLATKIFRNEAGYSYGEGFAQFVYKEDAVKVFSSKEEISAKLAIKQIRYAQRPLICSVLRGNGGICDTAWLKYLQPDCDDTGWYARQSYRNDYTNNQELDPSQNSRGTIFNGRPQSSSMATLSPMHFPRSVRGQSFESPACASSLVTGIYYYGYCTPETDFPHTNRYLCSLGEVNDFIYPPTHAHYSSPDTSACIGFSPLPHWC